jgi:2-polyprenyl-3-methyl-5-hydroxy-6-metoxy-1,4-benzoquinol methylase
MVTVSAHAEREHWAASRPAAVDAILEMLESADCKIGKRILDFGCGCGRILAGWEGRLAGASLYGVDINPSLVAFCKKAIPFAQVARCNVRPPLNFQAAMFDFIYAASVFTHMSREGALQWAAEMERLVKPGGSLLISFHGRYYEATLSKLSSAGLDELHRLGFYVHQHKGSKAEGSNDFSTFMSERAAETLFREFDLLKHFSGVPTHFASHQDRCVFRRKMV